MARYEVSGGVEKQLGVDGDRREEPPQRDTDDEGNLQHESGDDARELARPDGQQGDIDVAPRDVVAHVG